MVNFNKAGRLINSKSYSIFHKTISCTSTYKYLGILFSASGTFTPAKKNSVKPLFSLMHHIISQKPNIHTSIRIFDHTI